MKLLLGVCVLLSFTTFGQQDPLSSMYWNNYSYFNPAMCAVVNKHEANVTYRNQWDKVNGAPNSLFANYGINLADKHGLGVNYLHDAIGFTRTNQVKINYNYQLKLKADKKLVFGTGVSFHKFSMNPEWVAPVTTNDPSLPQGLNQTNFSIDLGLAYYGKNITAGLSVIHLPLQNNKSTTGTIATYSIRQHYYGNLRYKLDVFPEVGYLIFETKMRTDLVKYSQDFNVGFNYKNYLELGVGYRMSDAININLTGVIRKNFRIGYSYDITINKLASVSRGTHEIALGLRIPNVR